MSNLYAALEIGTTRTVLAVGETDSSGRLRVTAHAEIPSSGIRKSQILDIGQATESIRSVLHAIEENHGGDIGEISVGNALLAVSGQHIVAMPYSAAVSLSGDSVSQDDINSVINAAHSMPLPKERELLDIVDQDYSLDNRGGGVRNPRGMNGRVLSLNTLQIHGDRNRIQDARNAADAAHLEISESVYAVSCAAEAVLEEYEKKNGALVIDCGGGCTGYAAYIDGSIVATNVLGVGGDHITNDIAHAFQTTTPQAEGLKIYEASAMPVACEGEAARVKVERGENVLMDNRTVSRSALNTVVNTRVEELLTIIRDQLEEMDILHRLRSGVILTGGGSRLRNLEPLVEKIFGLAARIGRPVNVDGLDDAEYPPAFATIAGTLLYASRNYEEKSLIGDLLGRFFGK